MQTAAESADCQDVPDKATVVDQILTQKQPPPEPRDQVKRRAWLLASFWAVIIFLGLPIWLWTTTVYRASLPLERMIRWADGQACPIEYPIHVAIDAPGLEPSDLHQLVKISQQTLDDRDDVPSPHHLRFAAPGEAGREPDLTVVLNSKAVSQAISRPSLRPYEAVLDVAHAPLPLSNTPLSLDVLLTLAQPVVDASLSTFADEQMRLVYLLNKAKYKNLPALGRRLSSSDVELLDSRSARALKYASTYHLTFSLFTGSASPKSWDIRPALHTYLAPLLESFRAISTFTIDTQVQYYASLSPSLHGPTYDSGLNAWSIEPSALSGFINAAEWPLSPTIGEGPTVNFVIYVPAPSQSPLVIQGSQGTSWLIPQWGGVKIVNLYNSSSVPEHLSKADLDPVVLTLAEQLASLLGLPATPLSLPVRLSSLTRERATELILSASSTLGALSRLTLKLTSIAIPDNVAASVDETLSRLDTACADLREARYEDALRSARVAEQQAEKAFFDPSMVGQVYFPDEHKVAVYVPLLGPMAVPLVMALIKEVKAWIALWRAGA